MPQLNVINITVNNKRRINRFMLLPEFLYERNKIIQNCQHVKWPFIFLSCQSLRQIVRQWHPAKNYQYPFEPIL